MKSITTIFRNAAAIVFGVALGLSGAPAHAEDTDLFFTGAAGASSRPNVLIMLDNTANWSPMFTAEKNALKQVLQSLGLTPGVFNIGLMMFVETGGGNDNNDGTYVRFAVREFGVVTDDASIDNAADALFDIVKNLHILNDKSNNAVYGLAMNEAYKYFKGGVSYSQVQLKRDYPGNAILPPLVRNDSHNAFFASNTFNYRSPVADACQQNHIIIISNGKGNDNASATSIASEALLAEGGDTTPIIVTPNGYQSNVADEWTRFMARDPLPSETNKPIVYTHAILVQDAGAPNGQYPYDWEVFLQSVAVNGKGSFQKTDGSQSNIANALDRAFKEIQDVSSVFASSTLPINVNVRGTFLNQVYMGVFRPEAGGTPRWTGNLKLYKLAYNSATDTVFLADRNNATVEDPVSGFIKASATSFWTTTSAFWDQAFASGFYFYKDLETASDAPDGDFVEKGGAAQRLRSGFATDLAGRKVYTCIGCSGTLSNFDTANTDITAQKLALSDVATISNLTRSGGTATATTSQPHGFATGDSITISGAIEPAYNLSTTITVTSATSFTYPVTETPPGSASGTLIGRKVTAGSVAVTSITRSGTTATVSAPGHTFTNLQTVTIAGADQPEYNLAAVIGGVVPGVSFTYTVAESPSTTITLSSAKACPAATPAVITCPIAASTKSISAASRTAGAALTTIDTSPANHGFITGNYVLIEGLSPSVYNGRYQITKTGNKTFTYTPVITLGPASPATSVSGISAVASNPAFSITALGRSGTTVTGSTATAHGWVATNQIVISGANEAAYNGTFTLATASGSTFTFTVVVGPATPATGAITATRAGSVNREELIRWVRGENRLFEDNPSGNAAHVRGYHHGDVLHSRPAVVNYGRTNDNRDILVFYGANDGMLHAVKGGREDADGLEKWAYVAEDHFPSLKMLFTATPSILSTPRKYFFDGVISTYQKDGGSPDGTTTPPDGQLGGALDKVWLYAAMRRGGRGIHALDVSAPDAAPSLLWKKTNADVIGGYAELGQTWSEVQPITISAQTSPVVAFSLGYDAAANDPTDTSTTSSRQSTATMGRGVMVADAETGVPIWVATGNSSYTVPGGAIHYPVSGMDCAIASDVSAIDLTPDGIMDRLYVADTCANIWRINIGDPDPANWTVQKLAALGTGDSTKPRKFLFRPDVVRLQQEPNKLAILVGSGDREAPYDTTVSNVFYMIKDDVAPGTCTNCGMTDAGLCERNTVANSTAVGQCTLLCSGQTEVNSTTGLTCFQSCLAQKTPCAIDHDGDPATPMVSTYTYDPDNDASTINSVTVVLADRGWKYTYPTVGEKTVNAPLTLGGVAFFGTNIPQSLVNASSCGGLGEARLYQVEFSTGTPASDPNCSGISSYYALKSGGGFPPSPVGTVVTTDDGKTVEVVLSGPQIQKPPTVPIQKRNRIYWYKVLDR